MMWSRSDCDAL